MVGNPPGNAGDTGLIPDPEGSHTPLTAKPMCRDCRSPCTLEPVLCNTEVTAMRSPCTPAEEWAPLAMTRESPRAQRQLSIAKNINKSNALSDRFNG